MLRFVALFICLGFAFAQTGCSTPVWVDLPNQYSSTVVANMDTAGYTLAYSEYWDGTIGEKGRLRVDGRYLPSNQSEIIDFNDGLAYRFFPNKPETCVVMSLGFWANLTIIHPTSALFKRVNITNWVCDGVTTEARNISTVRWTGSVAANYSRPGASFTQEYTSKYYFAHFAGSTGYNVPVRVLLQGRRVNTTTPSAPIVLDYVHFYDWVNFVPGRPDPSLLTIPKECMVAPSYSRPVPYYLLFNDLPADGSYTVPQPLPANTPMPSLPSRFSALVEAKFHVDTSNSVVADQQAPLALRWTHTLVRTPQRTAASDAFVISTPGWTTWERLDYLSRQSGAAADEFDSVTKIFRFNPDNTNIGSAYTFSLSSDSCNTTQFSDSTPGSNPLRSSRAGVLPRLFTNPSFMSGAVYSGREVARGVPCDVWKRSDVNLTSCVTFAAVGSTPAYTACRNFVFDVRVLFFPEGWTFPGRGLPATSKLPVRVITNGVVIYDQGTAVEKRETYEDMFDIFQFNFDDRASFNSSFAITAANANGDVTGWTDSHVLDSAFSFNRIGCSAASAPVAPPSLPKSYSASVSANFLEKGYTIAYTEYYDGVTGLLRRDGRADGSNMIEVINERTGQVTVFPRSGTEPSAAFVKYTLPASAPAGTACITYTLPANARQNPNTHSTFEFITSDLNTTRRVYMGTDAVTARNVPSDVWRTWSSFSLPPRGNSTSFAAAYDTTLYFVSNRPAGVPIRVELNGVHYNPGSAPSIVHHVYDWYNWQGYDTIPNGVFTTPSTCLSVSYSDLPRVRLFPTTSQVLPARSMDLPISVPVFPRAFSAVVETKMDDDLMKRGFSCSWYADLPHKRERLDVVVDDYGHGSNSGVAASVAFGTAAPLDSNDGPVNPSSVYFYNEPTGSWLPDAQSLGYGKGTVYTLQRTFTNESDINTMKETCVSAPISSTNRLLLSRLRMGSIPQLLAQDPNNVNIPTVYEGRAILRGVPCDVWVQPNVEASRNNIVYKFARRLYFFPLGWAFPGRDGTGNNSIPDNYPTINPSQLQLLLAVTHQGLRDVSKPNPTPFSDRWDFFRFTPAPPTRDLFVLPDCGNTVPPDSSPSKLSGGAIAGIIVGLFLGIGGGIALACFLYDRHRKAQAAQSDIHNLQAITATSAANAPVATEMQVVEAPESNTA